VPNLAAGHETTSSALTWCLYALSRDHKIQARLREELRSVKLESNFQSDTICDSDSRESDLTDRISRCEYLEWVVQESSARARAREEDDIPAQTSPSSSSGDGGPNGYPWDEALGHPCAQVGHYIHPDPARAERSGDMMQGCLGMCVSDFLVPNLSFFLRLFSFCVPSVPSAIDALVGLRDRTADHYGLIVSDAPI
jgi:hypothetical protein